MNNFNYEKKYHYWVKYFVIAFPLIFCLFCILVKDYIIFNNMSIYDIYDAIPNLMQVPINQWYYDILQLLGFEGIYTSGTFMGVLIVYPLYVFWVYVFDLVLDVFVFVPKLAHKLMKKLGG